MAHCFLQSSRLIFTKTPSLMIGWSLFLAGVPVCSAFHSPSSLSVAEHCDCALRIQAKDDAGR